jgi:hypothetical protein
MLSSPLKKTRLMRYSIPVYNSMFNSFLNRYPIKPNLIYVKDHDPSTRQDVVTTTNINKPLKDTRKQKLCNKSTNKMNKFETHTKFKYYTTVGVSGTLILTFFYNYYKNAITILTIPK